MTDDDLLDDLDDDEPDFAALYEPHVDGDGWQMSPGSAMTTSPASSRRSASDGRR